MVRDGDMEVVIGLGVINLPNNPSLGVGKKDTDKSLVVEQRVDIEIKKQLEKANKEANKLG